MTLRHWLHTAIWFLLWLGAFGYAVHSIHNAWGLVILGGLSVSGFWLLVNTVDLLFGRWIRRGPQPVVLSQQPVVIRRIIIEEIHPYA